MSVRETLARFSPISLDELGDAALMDRVDRKYVVRSELIPELMERVVGDYRALEVGGVRMSRYSTTYFDTNNLDLYRAHHADRVPRTKVRVREYLDSRLRFVEVKERTNTGRTHKTRVAVQSDAEVIAGISHGSRIAADGESLAVVLDVAYTRMTLVRIGAPERVTIDVQLSFSHDGRTVAYPGLAFVEVKQPTVARSPFTDALRVFDVREGSVSKYCLGVARLVERAKSNRFKPAIARLEHTGKERVAAHHG